jgi:hemimethylated DNA binding protein
MRSVAVLLVSFATAQASASAQASAPVQELMTTANRTEQHAQDSVDTMVDKFMGNIFERAARLVPPGPGPNRHADLDDATLGKPGQVAIQPRTAGLRPVLPLRRGAGSAGSARATSGVGGASPWAVSHKHQIGGKATLRGRSASVTQPSRGCALRAISGFTEEAEANALVQSLQGTWEDDKGNEITINGETAKFSDWPGEWPLAYVSGHLILRGSHFVGSPDKPKWRFPNGKERQWIRKEPVTEEQHAWLKAFLGYKTLQLRLRRELWAAVVGEDFEKAAQLRTDYTQGTASMPPEASLGLQARLHAGKHLVPGVCFRHKKYGYRGVIIACEPWCVATSAWKENADVAELDRGEHQPFYHCLPDLRDRPGHSPKHASFLAEENLEPIAEAYPVEHPFAAMLLVQCDEIQGYLPSPMLEEVLRNQSSSGTFSLVNRRQ